MTPEFTLKLLSESELTHSPFSKLDLLRNRHTKLTDIILIYDAIHKATKKVKMDCFTLKIRAYINEIINLVAAIERHADLVANVTFGRHGIDIFDLFSPRARSACRFCCDGKLY